MAKLFPNLVSLKGHVGVPDLSTRSLMLNLKVFGSNSLESLHPFACLNLLPKAEEVSIVFGEYKKEDWPLMSRPLIKSLHLSFDDSIPFRQFKMLFSSFPNVEELSMTIRDVKCFNETVPNLT